MTISANRTAVISACVCWMLILSGEEYKVVDRAKLKRELVFLDLKSSKLWLFATAICFGICEKLSGVGNMISMERDWVPTLAARGAESDISAYSLTHINAVMRRIDLLCKLLAPVALSLVISFTSLPAGIILVAGLSTLSWGFEVWSARSVWQKNPRLRRPKVDQHEEMDVLDVVRYETSPSILQRFGSGIAALWTREASQMRRYFASDIWIPSFSLALLYLSVLQYSATFITFLLNSGFSLLLVTIARATSSVVEVSSTFLTPVTIKYLARPSEHNRRLDEDGGGGPLLGGHEQTSQDKLHSIGLIRSGLWGVTLQLCCLVSDDHSQLCTLPYSRV